MSALFAERRTWLGVGILAAILIVVAGWFALISPMRSDTAALLSQQGDAQARNAVLTQKIVALKRQEEGLPALQADLAAQLRGLPTTSGLPELTRQLTTQAQTAGVGLTSVVVGAITAADKAGAPSGSTTAAGRLFAIPVTLTTTGPAKGQIAFVGALQQVGPRRALVVSTTLAPVGATGSAGSAGSATTSIAVSSTMTTLITVFSAPVSPDDQAKLDRLIAGKSTS